MSDNRVTVGRLDVPFGHLVAFSFKAALAAIPALLLLAGVLLTARIGLDLLGFGLQRASESAMVERSDALPFAVQDSLWSAAYERAGAGASRDAVAAEWQRVFAEYERRQR